MIEPVNGIYGIINTRIREWGAVRTGNSGDLGSTFWK
jgi:hypothetical protein